MQLPKNAWQFHLNPFNSINYYQKLSTKIFSIIQIHFFLLCCKDNNATVHVHAALFLPVRFMPFLKPFGLLCTRALPNTYKSLSVEQGWETVCLL